VFSDEKGTVIVPSCYCRRDISWIPGSDVPDNVRAAADDASQEGSFFANLRRVDKDSVADSEATDDDSKDPTVDLTNVAVNTDLSTRVWTARGTSERVNAYDLQDAAACDEIANKAWKFVSRVNFEITYQRTATKGKASPIVSGICMKHIRYNMRTTKPLWLAIVYVPLQGVKQINSCWVVSAGKLASRKLLDEAKRAFSTFVIHLTLAIPKELNKLPTSAVPGTLATSQSGRPVRSRAKETKNSAKVRDCLS
jgi:hypothetical protein